MSTEKKKTGRGARLKKLCSKAYWKSIFTAEEKKKHLKHGTYSSAMTGIVIAVVVVVNLIVAQLPSQVKAVDLSTQKLYSVTDDTKKLIAGLDQDVTLYYIAQKGNEDDTIQKLLDHYQDLSSHISVEQKDPDLYPKFTSQYTDEKVASNSVIVVSGDKSKVVSGDEMWETSVDYNTYSSSTTGFDGEGQITGAISYVTSEHTAKAYWITGHGEAAQSDLAAGFTDAIAKNNMDIGELSLMTNEIPDEAQCIVIVSPASDYSEEEAQKVINYLENGGKALIFTSYTGTEQPNFDKILENYGVRRSDGIVVEQDSQHYFPQYPYYLLPEMGNNEITSPVSDTYVMLPVAQAIQQLDSYRDTITITSLLHTTQDAYLEEDPQNSTWSKKDDSETGSFDVGVKITESVKDDKETQLIYFSCAGMLSEQIDGAVSGANTKLAASALTSMCDVEESVLIPSKSLAYTQLMFTGSSVSTWSIMTIVVIPAVILMIGLGIWMRRRKQ